MGRLQPISPRLKVFPCSGASKEASAVYHITGDQLKDQPEGIYKPLTPTLIGGERIIVISIEELEDRPEKKYYLYISPLKIEPAAPMWFKSNCTYIRTEEKLYLEVK